MATGRGGRKDAASVGIRIFRVISGTRKFAAARFPALDRAGPHIFADRAYPSRISKPIYRHPGFKENLKAGKSVVLATDYGL